MARLAAKGAQPARDGQMRRGRKKSSKSSPATSADGQDSAVIQVFQDEREIAAYDRSSV
jgi:hypothetical protein